MDPQNNPPRASPEVLLPDNSVSPPKTHTFDRFMFDKMMPLSEAVEGYRLFNAMEAYKVIFTL